MLQVNWCFCGNISSLALYFSTRNEVLQDSFSQVLCLVLIPGQRHLHRMFLSANFSCRMYVVNTLHSFEVEYRLCPTMFSLSEVSFVNANSFPVVNTGGSMAVLAAGSWVSLAVNVMLPFFRCRATIITSNKILLNGLFRK